MRSRVLARLWFWRRSMAIAVFFVGTLMHTLLARVFRGSRPNAGGWGTDVRYALRSLRQSPWYAATVIGVIALGMTLATTVFAVVDGVLFRPLPYPDASRLVAIEPGFAELPAPAPGASTSSVRRTYSVSAVDIANWRAAEPDVAITAFRAQPWGGLGEGVNESPYGVAMIEPNFFETIGVHPRVGGFIAADFDHEDILRPVVITHDHWQSRFRGMKDVVGQRFIGDPTSGWGFRVVGVMPAGFLFPSSRASVRFLTPLVPDRARALDPTIRNLPEVIARVPAHTDVEAVRRRLEAGSAITRAMFPARGPKPANRSERGWRMDGPFDRVDAVLLAGRLGRDERPLFGAVFVAAFILLVLGGLNASGLMTARGLDRARELALRRALGASGLRIARLVSIEAALPIAIGSLSGLALAVPLLHVGERLLPEELLLFRAQNIAAIDLRVAVFVLLSTLVLAMLTTIWPIRRALDPAAASMAEGGRGSTRTRSVGRTAVVVSQVAGALVLTLCGGLLVTSILSVYARRPPLRTQGIVVLGESLLGAGVTMNKAPERTVRINALIETLRRVPGVFAVALTDAQTLVGGGETSWFTAPAKAAKPRLTVGVHAVTSDFYRVLELQLVMGRFPTAAELASDAPVIVVSESVARAYWLDASPIGQTLNEQPELTPYAVVGVVRDVRWNSWDTEVASIYGPYARLSRFPFPTVFVRTAMTVNETLALATSAIAAVDPLISTRRAGKLDELFADSVRPRRFQSWLFGSFAMAALVIVGSGILGLIAMSTARRTREMGIRLALGSTREALVRLLLREQLLQVAAGVVAGSLVSAWAVRFVRSLLYEITPYDPRVWAAAIAVILLTTVMGTLIPAWRAGRTDPVKALRIE
jgi:predicted permease